MYGKYINNGYIIGVGTGSGGEKITEQEYNAILEKINKRPEAPEGYSYRLTTAMEWELAEVPKIEPTTGEIIESEEDYYG